MANDMDTNAFLEGLERLVPGCIKDEDKKQWADKPYNTEAFGSSLAFVEVKHSKQVAQILKYCTKHDIGVVPVAGNTNLVAAAGASGLADEILLHVADTSITLDKANHLVEAGAAVTIEALQQYVEEAGYFFPLDFGAKGSAELGATTNPGGINFFRFGGMRELVHSTECVDGNGTIYPLPPAVHKDNRLPDMLQLMQASQGMLGVVTRLRLHIYPKQQQQQSALLGFDDIASFPAIKATMEKHLGETLTAMELIAGSVIPMVEQHTGLTCPLDGTYPYYFYLNASSAVAEAPHFNLKAMFEQALEEGFNEGLFSDGTIAQDGKQALTLKRLREEASDAIRAYAKGKGGYAIANDISVRVGDIPVFVTLMQEATARYFPAITLSFFGHAADGNLHFNAVALEGNAEPQPASEKTKEPTKQLTEAIDSFCAHAQIEPQNIAAQHFEAFTNHTVNTLFGGSHTAEHGTGMKNIAATLAYTDPTLLALYKKLQTLFDPADTLQKGRKTAWFG